MNMNDDQQFQVLMAQMQERNHAWHQMRARSMQFTLWVLGLAVAASWHLLHTPCEGIHQKIVISVLALSLAMVSIYFLKALSGGAQRNKQALINIETELGLHAEEKPILPEKYKKVKNGWSAHFITLYLLLAVTLLYLLLTIWMPVYGPNKPYINS